jgi:hypothetical protein
MMSMARFKQQNLYFKPLAVKADFHCAMILFGNSSDAFQAITMDCGVCFGREVLTAMTDILAIEGVFNKDRQDAASVGKRKVKFPLVCFH